MKETRVTIIVVDYNSLEKTLEYIKCIFDKITGCVISCVIVDNSDEPRIKKILTKNNIDFNRIVLDDEEYISFMINGFKVIYYLSRNNGGYAKGNNTGYRIADRYFKPEYIIFSNNDLKINDRSIDFTHYMNIFEMNSEVSVIGPRIIGLHGELQSPYKKTSIWNSVIAYNLLWPLHKLGIPLFKFDDLMKSDKSSFCYWVQGSFFIIKSIDFKNINGFDENTFLYCEEMILAERLKKIDKKMYYDNRYTLIHEHGGSTKKSMRLLDREKKSLDSRMYYYRNYMGVNSLTIYLGYMSFYIYCLKKKIQIMVDNKTGD